MTGRTRTAKPHIGRKLSELMADRGMLPVEVAFYTNVSESSVYRWLLNETVPHPTNLKALATLLNVEVRDLYDTQEAA